MLSTKMEDALNAQINAEFRSAYLYLSMSADFSALGLKGFAHWFSVQFREEQDHARMLIDYVIARGGRVRLQPIAAVASSWETPLEAFEQTLEHERKVTGMIGELCRLAADENDFATSARLVWFVNEQVEEESTDQELIDRLKMVSDDRVGLYLIDRDLALRSYSVPSGAGQ